MWRSEGVGGGYLVELELISITSVSQSLWWGDWQKMKWCNKRVNDLPHDRSAATERWIWIPHRKYNGVSQLWVFWDPPGLESFFTFCWALWIGREVVDPSIMGKRNCPLKIYDPIDWNDWMTSIYLDCPYSPLCQCSILCVVYLKWYAHKFVWKYNSRHFLTLFIFSGCSRGQNQQSQGHSS